MEYTDGNVKFKTVDISKLGEVLDACPKVVETIPVKLLTDNMNIIQVFVQKSGVFVNVNVAAVVTRNSTYEKIEVAKGMPIPLFDFGDGKNDGIAFGSVDGSPTRDVTFTVIDDTLYLISRGINIKDAKCFCNFNYIAKT